MIYLSPLDQKRVPMVSENHGMEASEDCVSLADSLTVNYVCCFDCTEYQVVRISRLGDVFHPTEQHEHHSMWRLGWVG